MEAIRQGMGDTVLDPVELEQAQSASLKQSFEAYLGKVIEDRRLRGRPEPSQARVNSMLAEFQLRRGLSAELQGMLDLIEPDDYTRKQLRDFFKRQPALHGWPGHDPASADPAPRRRHRHPAQGRRHPRRANARIAEVKARLRPDGSKLRRPRAPVLR